MVYTLSSLKDLGPKVRWGVDVQQAVDSVAASDANTVVIKFKQAAPRFFDLLTYKYDIGVYIVPKHIFSANGEWANFKFFDLAKGRGRSSPPQQSRRSLICGTTGGQSKPV